MTPREEAIADCKYALLLGTTALWNHFAQWMPEHPLDSASDLEYRKTLFEIRDKHNTEECLLKEVK